MTTSIPLSDLESTPAAKFTTLGDKHAGRITAMNERQQTDINKNPLTFQDGRPRMLWVITIQKDNGDVVAFYAKGGKFTPAKGDGDSMLNAIGVAVRAAGADSVEIGGTLAVAYTGEAEPKPGQSPAKLYTAQYKPPATASIPVDLFGDDS